MPLPVESAVVCLTAITYRCPLLARHIDVFGQGAVQQEVALHSLVPCHQAVFVGDIVGLGIFIIYVAFVLYGYGNGGGFYLVIFHREGIGAHCGEGGA